MTRAEEKVKAADKWILSQENGYKFRVRDIFVAGYEQAEKDLGPIIEAATIVYEAWNGGTMGDVRNAMELLEERIKEAKK